MEEEEEEEETDASGASPNLAEASSLVSVRRAILQRALSPVLSLKNIKVSRKCAGQFLVFFLKVAALETVRRGSLATCPHVWWGIQGISLLQVPPLRWLQHWTPLRLLIQGTQVFTKPLLFLSIATAITDGFCEQRAVKDDRPGEQQSVDGEQRDAEAGQIFNNTLVPLHGRDLVAAEETYDRINTLELLKSELEKAGIDLTERLNDDELERFLVSSNGNVKRFILLVRKTIHWRSTFYFLTPQELESWSDLVFWHGHDMQLRPSLVIRLGQAYSILKTDERPRFAQAVVSQVEYGITSLLNGDDPRITVILDCEGTTVLGFPMHMMKSFCVLVQENYPTRLAALFAVNLPPVVRVIVHAIIQDEYSEPGQLHSHGELQSKLWYFIQILRPATRKKIHLEVEQSVMALAEHHGGTAHVPNFLGGNCRCLHCQRSSLDFNRHMMHTNREPCTGAVEEENMEDIEDQYQAPNQNMNNVLRAIIVGILVLWLIVALMACLYDSEQETLLD